MATLRPIAPQRLTMELAITPDVIAPDSSAAPRRGRKVPNVRVSSIQ